MNRLPDNYNPVFHDCDAKGCWNKQYRPNIEYFYHALPGKITMSDIDAVAEVAGNFLFMEWKSHQGELPTGQRILAERLTRLSPKITYIVVQHEPKNPMNIESIKVVHNGKFGEWEQCSMLDLFERVKHWADKISNRESKPVLEAAE